MSQVGVLALQGAFSKHRDMLSLLGIESFELRYPEQLEIASGLIMPGGESTTMWRLMEEKELIQPLKKFEKPIFGTCAGLILLCRLGRLEVQCERNAYGRQSASFEASFPSSFGMISGLFIRAPRIKNVFSSVEVLARYNEEPVLVKQGNVLASTFHPELTHDTKVHGLFRDLLEK